MSEQQENTSLVNGGETAPTAAASKDLDHAGSGTTQQFVTFTIGDEEYGVDIMAVREIKGWSETTMLPNAPEYMRGVLNLRGLIVPIFDLRRRFGGQHTETTKLHVIIIIAVGDRMLGLLVDAVSDILSVGEEEVRGVPKMNRRVDDEYLSGLVTVKDRMVALLHVERLFSQQAVNEGVAAAQRAEN